MERSFGGLEMKWIIIVENTTGDIDFVPFESGDLMAVEDKIKSYIMENKKAIAVPLEKLAGYIIRGTYNNPLLED
jgi:hypothetical protein